MRSKVAPLCVAAMLACLSTMILSPSATAQNTAGKTFTNEDVVELLKAGLSDAVVINKIKQAPEVSFRLETSDLVLLKKQGASPEVISAMLAKATPPEESAPQAGPSLGALGKTGTALLITKSGRKELQASVGEYSRTGFAFVYMSYFNYPGLRASVRTDDRRPSLLIRSDFDPSGHYYIGKLDPDQKLKARSLKINGKSRGFSEVSGIQPDSDWQVGYTAQEEQKHLWKLTPNADLEAGEYGLFDGARLFGFGVD